MEIDPSHLGVIIDGNRRYAKKSGKSLVEVYTLGATKVYNTVRFVFTKTNINELTIYALSYDNLVRNSDEIRPILNAQKETFEKWLTDDIFAKNKIQVRFIGELELLPKDIKKVCDKLGKMTSINTKKTLNILMAYSSHREIGKTIDKIIKDITLDYRNSEGKEHITDIVNNIGKNLDITTPVNLIIRNADEKRLSDFLLWQSNYAEMYSIEKLWPEITEKDIKKALTYFSTKKIKHGL